MGACFVKLYVARLGRMRFELAWKSICQLQWVQAFPRYSKYKYQASPNGSELSLTRACIARSWFGECGLRSKPGLRRRRPSQTSGQRVDFLSRSKPKFWSPPGHWQNPCLIDIFGIEGFSSNWRNYELLWRNESFLQFQLFGLRVLLCKQSFGYNLVAHSWKLIAYSWKRLCLQLEAFCLQLEACLLTIGTSFLTIEIFTLTVGKCV